jgi:hypothetical protein
MRKGNHPVAIDGPLRGSVGEDHGSTFVNKINAGFVSNLA